MNTKIFILILITEDVEYKKESEKGKNYHPFFTILQPGEYWKKK